MANKTNTGHAWYTASVGGSSWSRGPTGDFKTIREAREWAEGFGTTADYCYIKDKKGRHVASHIRMEGRWRRACIG
jgi:hypothetical protein